MTKPRQAALILLCLLASIYLSSYSSGPTSLAGDVTGSPLTVRTCASCHNGGRFRPMTTISLLDNVGQQVTSYQPNQLYRLQVEIDSDPQPNAYGLQAVVLDSNNNQAGTFGTPANDLRISTFDARNYLEHRRRLSQKTISIDWTAPEKGTGPITVYAAGNAVDAGGGQGGDNVKTATLNLPEAAPLGVGAPAWPADWRILNVGRGHIALVNDGARSSHAFPEFVLLYDLTGRSVRSTRLQQNDQRLDLTHLDPGMHVLQIETSQGARSSKMIMVF